MDYSLLQKFKMWMCKTFGHKFNKDIAWVYGGGIHNTCKRCKHVISNYDKEA